MQSPLCGATNPMPYVFLYTDDTACQISNKEPMITIRWILKLWEFTGDHFRRYNACSKRQIVFFDIATVYEVAAFSFCDLFVLFRATMDRISPKFSLKEQAKWVGDGACEPQATALLKNWQKLRFSDASRVVRDKSV
jgi:hypothetical protein